MNSNNGNGPPMYGSPAPNAGGSLANSSEGGFGGATMGTMGSGQLFGTQRPQFGTPSPTAPASSGESNPNVPSIPSNPSNPSAGGQYADYAQYNPSSSMMQSSNFVPYNANQQPQQPPPQQQQQQQHQQSQQQQPMMQGQGQGQSPHPVGYPAGTGSISRFAPPPSQQPPASANNNNNNGMSFASRGAMLHQQHHQQPAWQSQQQQQQQQYGQQPQYRQQPPMQQQQQQQQQHSYMSNSGSNNNNNNMYGASPQQARQQPPPVVQTPSSGMSFAQRSAAMHQSSNVYGGGAMQQQQQQQQQPSYAPQGGSYAPSQGQGQGQQPNMQSNLQYRPQPTMGLPQQQQQQQPQPNMNQSYAQRSTMAGSQPSQAQPNMQSSVMSQQQPNMQPQMQQPQMPQQPPPTPSIYVDPPEVVAQQNRLLTDATRKVQEHAYYMKQAMERNDLPVVLERAAAMVAELGEHAHSHHHHNLHPPAPGATGTTTALNPKNYYELHLRALEELPTLEDYFLQLSQPNPNVVPGADPSQQQQPPFTMLQLYDYVQYCPNVLARLYLQICAASALIRSGQAGAPWVFHDMIQAVKCVQNPVRGLFLRHYLLQAMRSALPDEPITPDQIALDAVDPSQPAPAPAEGEEDAPPVVEPVPEITEKGTVRDSYKFVLANFVEMNKLWVRIQHLPGDGRSKEIRRRREKDRNELRILVGTNLVRLSALNSVTSQIYGQIILPTVLQHIVVSGDPLAQAYLIDCIVQVFPDEYHIETMPILLAVCPKLRDKVNIRTILQSLMNRLANYLADEELLDEKDSNQVKRSMAQDSFRMIDECVQKVYNARGPKLQAKEVIRLQTALLSFSMKCYKGNLEQVSLCLDNCVVALQQARANQALMLESRNQHLDPNQPRVLPQLDAVAAQELEKLLSIPLDELALGVLTLDHYANLIGFLPWSSRRQVALTMLEAVSKAGASPKSIREIEELFAVITPVLRDEPEATYAIMERTTHLMAGLGVSPSTPGGTMSSPESEQSRQDAALVSKLIHLLEHSDTDVHYEMLTVASHHLGNGKIERTGSAYVALVFAALSLVRRIVTEETKVETPAVESEEKTPEESEPAETPDEDEKAPEEEVAVETVSEDDDNDEAVEEKTEQAAVVPDTSANDGATEEVAKAAKTVGCRKVLVFVQQCIATLAKAQPERGIKLYLEAALTVDKLGKSAGAVYSEKNSLGSIAYELVAQSFSLYEEHSADSRLQSRCIVQMIGTVLASRSLAKEDYEGLIMKITQYSAKILKKPDQCAMVAQCAHLFYAIGEKDEVLYSNPQRSLECLQRALKLADASTNIDSGNVSLFVDLLEHYLFFFEKKHPLITANYITGLVALIKEHTDTLSQMGGMDTSRVGEAKAHFIRLVVHIKKMATESSSDERFAGIDVSCVST
eukprot:Nitzschia sp. Nitz4//scaffold89_size161592//113938//118236//NITZ4_002391-RA/size161592-snap-gene-0.178-mRNA-1//-1//CDS//3329559655//1769//frame0